MRQALVILLATIFYISNAAKIGIFTAAIGSSQMIFSIRVAEALAEDGHDVVLIRPTYDPKVTKLVSTNKKIREIRIEALPDPSYFQNYTEIKRKDIFTGLDFAGLMTLSSSIKAMLADETFIESIRKENFDLAFHNHIEFCQLGANSCGNHFSFNLLIPVSSIIWEFPSGCSRCPDIPHRNMFIDLGIPFLPSTFPGILMNATNQMSFTERAKSLLNALIFDVIYPYKMFNPQDEMFRAKFGKSFPSVTQLKDGASMNFVNADSLIEFPIAHTNKMQFVGGLGTKATKPLQEPFLSFASSASRLVVVSFGSVAVSWDMPQHWKDAFVQLFRMNPEISFVWKFEEEIEVPANVLRIGWLPQNDLLAHNRTSAFITHGGYNSLGESIGAGVPCLFVPLFADQFRNSLLAKYRGFGLQLPKHEISAESLNHNLQRILSEDSFKMSVVQLQKIVKERPLKPDDSLRYWTNFVLQYDIDMDMPRLSFIQLYSLDIIGCIVAFFAVLFVVLRKLARWYYWSCCEMSYKEKEKLQ